MTQLSEAEGKLLEYVSQTLERVCLKVGIYKPFKVRLHRSWSHTSARYTIYINPGCNGIMYDLNSIIGVALHELAHVVVESDLSNNLHDSHFVSVMAMLVDAPVELHLYNPSLPLQYTHCTY